MEERRKHKRFKLKLPAKIEVLPREPQGEARIVRVESDNIGPGGAFFPTLTPIPEGTPVKVDIALRFRKVQFPISKRPLLSARGHVLRSEPSGMAIRFEKRYTIVPS